MSEPTDTQIEAALTAYWSTALAEAKAQSPDTDAVMRKSMRAALVAAAAVAHDEMLDRTKTRGMD